MKVFLFLLLFWIALSLLVNIFRFQRTKRYFSLFEKQDGYLVYCEASVDRLFEVAGVNYRHRLGAERNLPVSRFLANAYYRNEVRDTFQAAISVFRFRLINAINPAYIFEKPFLTLHRLCTRKRPGRAVPKPVKCVISLVLWFLGVVASHYVEAFLDSGASRCIFEVCRNILK